MRDYANFFKLCEIAYFMCYKVNYANIMPDHNPGHSNGRKSYVFDTPALTFLILLYVPQNYAYFFDADLHIYT